MWSVLSELPTVTAPCWLAVCCFRQVTRGKRCVIWACPHRPASWNAVALSILLPARVELVFLPYMLAPFYHEIVFFIPGSVPCLAPRYQLSHSRCLFLNQHWEDFSIIFFLPSTQAFVKHRCVSMHETVHAKR